MLLTVVRAQISLLVFFCLALSQNAFGQASPIILEMGLPAVAVEDDNTLLIAFPIANSGTSTAYNVEITSISLRSAKRIRPIAFPLDLGNLTPKKRAVAEAAFWSPRLVRNRRYLLEVKGTYLVAEEKSNFSIHQFISLAPSAPGSARVSNTEIRPHSVSGAYYPHRDITLPSEVNPTRPPLPIGRLHGNLTPATTGTTVEVGRLLVGNSDAVKDRSPFAELETSHPAAFAEVSLKSSLEPAPQGREVVFIRNTALGNFGGFVPNDPSGATGGIVFNGTQTVLATGNRYGLFSADGGSTFRQLDPTTIFPNNFDGGVCCDQVVHYSQSINRFIWLMQFTSGSNGQNRLRIAAASPEALIASKGTAWTFWDLTCAALRLGNNSMDFPDLAVGNTFLYVSVDSTGGLLVARVPLTELRDGAAIHVAFTNPANGIPAYGAHLTQNSRDEMFWSGFVKNSLMRIFSWKEGSNTYFWRDVNVNSWPTEYTSTSPDGTDWLASLFYTGPTGTRVFSSAGIDEMWFAWGAGRGGNFPHAHIQLLHVRHSNFSVIEQTQIWNPNFAFGLPSLTTARSGVVGMSLSFGGGSFFGSPAVGILGQGVVHSLCSSSANQDKFGDYSSVRLAFPKSALFQAEGYCVTPGRTFEPHFVIFGRRGDVNAGP